jgi:radical SAM superfamily enzyme YgiQ (UPF0313 family)
MKQCGFNVSAVNLCHSDEPVEKQLATAITKDQIDVLCTGAMSCHWNELNSVLEVARRIKPKIITVVGGAIIISDPMLAMQNMPIDYGIIGEGEITMAELAVALSNGDDVNRISGIIYRTTDNCLITTNPRPSISDLDTLPFPDYDALEYDKFLSIKWVNLPAINGILFDIDEEQRLSEIVTSRSCPFNCTFCYHPLGKKYRQRSLDNVFKEIEYITQKYHITLINLIDDLFSINEKRIYEFSQRVIKFNVRWMAQWRVSHVNKQIMKAIKESGFLILSLGVESISDKILRSMKKKITRTQIEQAFKNAGAVGVRACGNIILGDPEDTEETVNESIDWVKKNPQYEINLGFIKAIPDSQVFRYAMSKNLINDKLQYIKERFPIINLTSMDDEKFYRIKRKVDIWAFNKTHLIAGKLISSKKLSQTYSGANIYTFKVECPLCWHTSKYRYIKYSSKPHTVVLCKHCYKCLKINTKDTFYDDYNAVFGYLFHYGYIIYNLYLTRIVFVRNIARKIRALFKKQLASFIDEFPTKI